MLNQNSEFGNWKLYGSTNPAILIAGHSHTFAMFMAIQNSSKLNKIFGLVSRSDFSHQDPYGDEYWNYVASLSGSQPTAISWNGNQHNIHFLVESGLMFKTINFNSNSDFVGIAESQIEKVFEPTFYELELILDRFPNKKNLCLLGTPPPKSKKFLDQRLNEDEYFKSLAANAGVLDKKLSASSDELRSYMWLITQNLTKKIAEKIGAKFLSVPESAHDNNFILDKKFYTDDLTHANENFGELMLDSLMSFYGLGDYESSI